jgi:hypothetical protein
MIDEMDPEGAAKMLSLKELMEFAKLLQGEELQGVQEGVQ